MKFNVQIDKKDDKGMWVQDKEIVCTYDDYDTIVKEHAVYRCNEKMFLPTDRKTRAHIKHAILTQEEEAGKGTDYINRIKKTVLYLDLDGSTVSGRYMLDTEIEAQNNLSVAEKAIDKLDDDMSALDKPDSNLSAIAEYLKDLIPHDEALANLIIQPKKTLMGCFNYVTNKAKETALNNCAMVKSDIVFEWVIEYFIDDNHEEGTRPASYKRPAPVYKQNKPKPKAKETSNDSDKPAQISLFDGLAV